MSDNLCLFFEMLSQMATEFFDGLCYQHLIEEMDFLTLDKVLCFYTDEKGAHADIVYCWHE